ncbi:MAG: hypothetical protein M3Z20_21315 [Chloroflexota bacterium]|nr:hypothetical protein [Chloroflexota bacterium]
MDATRFDHVTQWLATAGTRRDVARTLGGFFLAGGVGAFSCIADTVGKRKKKKRKKNGKKRPSCKPACQGKTCGPDGCNGSCGSCTGNQTCQGGACAPPLPTCTDGVRNGSESDIDCGGSCPRCAAGKTCASRNDCASALCHTVLHTCQTCTPDTFDCGGDADGSCVCDTTVQGQKVCNKQNVGNPTASCDTCAAGTNCVDTGGGTLFCFKPCGAT